MPAIDQRLQHAGIFRAQVAKHDVGAAHRQPAAVLDAGNRGKSGFHQRRDAADGAGPIGHRRVHGQHRRGLGDAIAFQDADAEALHVDRARALLHRLGAGEHQAQGAEVVGVRRACVSREEGVGAEQDGGAGLVDQFGHDAVVQRRRVHEDRNAGHQRHHQPAGQTERVEHRQHIEHLVVGIGIDPRQRLRGIGENVAVGQHHALGHAFGSRREQDDRGILRAAHHARRCAVAQSLDLVGETDRAADVLEIDDLGLRPDRGNQLVELALLDERARCQHGPDLGGLHRGQHIDRPGREIQHRRHPADGLQRHEHHGNAGGVRQQHADVLADARAGLELAAQHLRAEDQLAVGQRRAQRVLDDRLAGVAGLVGVGETLEQGLVQHGGLHDRIDHDVLQRGAGGIAAGLAAQRLVCLLYTSRWTSVVSITQEAEVAQGTFYVYFRTKEDVLRELVLRMGRRLRRSLTLATAGIDDRLEVERRGIHAFFDFVRKNPNLYRVVAESQFVDEAAYRAYYTDFAASYRSGLEAAVARGEISPGDAELRAWALMGVSDMAGRRYALWDTEASFEAAAEAVFDFVAHGLAPKREA